MQHACAGSTARRVRDYTEGHGQGPLRQSVGHRRAACGAVAVERGRSRGGTGPAGPSREQRCARSICRATAGVHAACCSVAVVLRTQYCPARSRHRTTGRRRCTARCRDGAQAGGKVFKRTLEAGDGQLLCAVRADYGAGRVAAARFRCRLGGAATPLRVRAAGGAVQLLCGEQLSSRLATRPAHVAAFDCCGPCLARCAPVAILGQTFHASVPVAFSDQAAPLFSLATCRRRNETTPRSGALGGPGVWSNMPSQPRPDSSVVERGPEKAGVGGSIPSLATTPSITWRCDVKRRPH